MKDVFIYRVLRNRTAAVAASMIAACLVFSATFLFSFNNSYKSYWQAIFRVQTVDFNMVSHVFPPLIRNHIIKNDIESLKMLLASNFSAFKMAVDACVDLKCSAYRELATNGGRSSGQLLEVPVFRNTKAPVTVRFEHGYSQEPVVTAADGLEVLGRLRLYRAEPPTLIDELSLFLHRASSGEAYASRYIAYFANLYSSLFLSFSFFLFFVLVRNYYLEKRLRKGIATLLRKAVMKNYV
jgi:hypothetical protein